MLTRALFALVLICGAAAAASADDAKVLAFGITDHEVNEAELEKGGALPAPRFNSPGVAYVWAANVKKGDVIEIALVKGDAPLLSNTETLAEDQVKFLLQAGKRGVPAGGWPEGEYRAAVTITRDGKSLVAQTSPPIPFE